MRCHFIAFYQNDALVGIAISQYLDVSKLKDFGSRDRCFRTWLRNLIFNNFATHVLFMGNNMLSGENSFLFDKNCDAEFRAKAMIEASEILVERYRLAKTPIDIVNFKDFTEGKPDGFSEFYESAYRFSTQPAMLFEVDIKWKSFDDYLAALSKKYRDQYKRATKKSALVSMRQMDLEQIVKFRHKINELYLHVAENAPFNTFFLAENHFEVFKQFFVEDFIFTGYFLGDKMIGFNTLIKNGSILETYFLGYDDDIQKEHLLYLNMLYQMIEHGIENDYEEINFARTALEIKSSIGAKPRSMHGYIKHRNPLINRKLDWIFKKVEPKIAWHQRHPYKN